MTIKTIAIDAMTNEEGPKILVKAVKHTLKEHKDLELILVGDDSIKSLEQSRIHTEYAPKFITGEDSLRQILQKLERSSTYVTAELVKKERADIGLSFGNTKAVELAVIRNLEPLNGLKKIPLAVAVPSKKGDKYAPTIFLDVGGTGLDDISPHDLVYFGFLGNGYARQIGIKNPKIALLSNGEEKTKGTKLTREAYKLYEEYALKNNYFNFFGFCEPESALVRGENKPDVVVCDGYVGNMILKTLEAFYSLYWEALEESARLNLIHKVALGIAKLTGVFRFVRKTMHPDQYGGAIFLGLSRPFIKGHGASNEFAIRNAIELAYGYSNQPFLEEMVQELKRAKEYCG